jgi:hypothetical protein
MPAASFLPSNSFLRRITSASERSGSRDVSKHDYYARAFSCDSIFAIVARCFGMLFAFFLLFRNQQQGIKKLAKRFLLSNWK